MDSSYKEFGDLEILHQDSSDPVLFGNHDFISDSRYSPQDRHSVTGDHIIQVTPQEVRCFFR